MTDNLCQQARLCWQRWACRFIMPACVKFKRHCYCPPHKWRVWNELSSCHTCCVYLQLQGGYFDRANGTSITAYDENGNQLLRVTNTQTAYEFLGLATNDGSAQIKGVLFSLSGGEAGGFAIDDVRFTYGCCGN